MPMNQHRGGTSSTGKNPFQTSWLRAGLSPHTGAAGSFRSNAVMGSQPREREAGWGVGMGGWEEGRQIPRVLSACHAMVAAVYPLGKREAPRDLRRASSSVLFSEAPDGRGCDRSAGVMMEAGLSCSGWREWSHTCQGTVKKWKTCPDAAESQMMSRFSDWQGRLAPFKEMRNTGGSDRERGWWRDPVGNRGASRWRGPVSSWTYWSGEWSDI